MWNQSKSLVLTAWWIRAALVLWLGIAVGLPFFLREPAILVLFYLIFVPVLTALYGLNKMLRNIQRGVVFAAMNVSCLRLVSSSFLGMMVIIRRTVSSRIDMVISSKIS